MVLAQGVVFKINAPGLIADGFFNSLNKTQGSQTFLEMLLIILTRDNVEKM
jgi:hypothetical protein